MLSESLLLDFLTSDLSLTDLAARHNLSLDQLIAWADSPGVVQLFDDLQRISTRRSAMIACDSSATALSNLAQLSHELVKRAELANAAPSSPPKPPSITAIETSRKTCTALLRLCTRNERASAKSAGRGRTQSPPSETELVARLSEACASMTNPPRTQHIPAQPTAPSTPTLQPSADPFTSSPPHPFTPPHAQSRPAHLAAHAGTLSAPPSPSASRLSHPSLGGISTG